MNIVEHCAINNLYLCYIWLHCQLGLICIINQIYSVVLDKSKRKHTMYLLLLLSYQKPSRIILYLDWSWVASLELDPVTEWIIHIFIFYRKEVGNIIFQPGGERKVFSFTYKALNFSPFFMKSRKLTTGYKENLTRQTMIVWLKISRLSD